jgi:hypothetical protein
MPRAGRPDEQPALALVRGPAAITDADRQRAARACRIGPEGEEYWLDWRSEPGRRPHYIVCWHDRASRCRRRAATGIGAGDGVAPPRAAHEALAARYAARQRAATPQPPAEVGLSRVLTHYLASHCDADDSDVRAPERQAYCIASLNRFIAAERKAGRLGAALPVSHVDREFVGAFAGFRRREGVGDATIKRELGTLRAAINLAADDGLLAYKPYVPKLQGARKLRTRAKTRAYGLAQLAAILEAAWADSSFHDVHIFVVAMLATHTRVEAAIECDLDAQYRHGVIDFLGDAPLTKKRRAVVPVVPTLAAWIDGRKGMLVPRADPAFERHDKDSFAYQFERAVLRAAGREPTLGLRLPVLGTDGEQQRAIRRGRNGKGQPIDMGPKWRAYGSPNTLRHTIHTQLRRIGVPKAQIDAASGHAEQGTGENYSHFDALEDLRDFSRGVEQLFDELRRYTDCHVRTQREPNIIILGGRSASKVA